MISLVFFPRPAYVRSPLCARRAQSGREMTFANFVLATRPDASGPFLPPLFPRAPSFVRARKGKGGGRDEFHRDAMTNAAMSASRRETAWFVRFVRADAANTVLRDCPKARGFTRFRRSSGAPRGGAFASTLDLFAVHFARFSSRKSASASPDATARGAQHASPPLSCRGVAAKICMRFVGKAKHAAAIIRGKIRVLSRATPLRNGGVG